MLADSSSPLRLDDTIAAIACAPGGGLRGIVRISGAGCRSVIERLFTLQSADCGPALNTRLPTCIAGEVLLPPPLGAIPAKLMFWPTHRSYTRQPTAELHTIGSRPILQAVVDAACRAGARLANPGEFTMRSFLAGRIDLPQAEAVLGVIDARDQAGLHAALTQLAGNLSRPLLELRDSLLDLLSHLEAGLDFVDEDIEFVSRQQLDRELRAALDAVTGLEAKMHARGAANELPRVVLVGPPNAGKSSLFNVLAGTDAAIVSSLAGTTRDYVSCAATIQGVECSLIDTAGLEEAIGDEIQVAAQAFSHQSRADGDVILWCQEVPKDFAPSVPHHEMARVLFVATKIDANATFIQHASWLGTSARTGAGLAELRSAIVQALQEQHPGGVVPATAIRCRASLRGAKLALEQALEVLDATAGEELVAAELRLAIDELGQVLGAVYTDDLLDRIFSRFCIGK